MTLSTVGTVREWVRRRPVFAKPVRNGLKVFGKMFQRSAIRTYIRTHSVRKLQIGSLESLLDGWLNTDIFPQAPGVVALDACRPYPIASETFDYVFSEHQFEHIAFAQGRKMLVECLRILKPGGTIRISFPGLEPLMALYTGDAERSEEQENYIRAQMKKFPEASYARAGFAINSAFLFHNHRFMYDRQTLRDLAENVGFTFKGEYKPSISDDPNLQGIDFRTSLIDQYETVVLEFTKPRR